MFLLDHNVMRAIQGCLEDRGHDVAWSRDLVGQEAADPIVAAAAAQDDRILVSHDHDMKRVQRYLSEAHRARHPNLSRLMLQCEQAVSLVRLQTFISLIEFEFELASENDQAFLVYVQERRIVIAR